MTQAERDEKRSDQVVGMKIIDETMSILKMNYLVYG